MNLSKLAKVAITGAVGNLTFDGHLIPVVLSGDESRMVAQMVPPFSDEDKIGAISAAAINARLHSQSDHIVLVIDSYIARHTAEEYETGDVPRPSEDPAATDALLVYEAKGGQQVGMWSLEYGRDDQGNLVFREGQEMFDARGRLAWFFTGISAMPEEMMRQGQDLMLAAYPDIEETWMEVTG